MLNTREALGCLDRDFLETRGKILEVAAVLDRIDRAPSHHHEHPDPRLGQIRQALEALLRARPRPRRRSSSSSRSSTTGTGRRLEGARMQPAGR